MVAGVELTYNTSATALQMANTIFGDGVTVVGASYTGDNDSSAIYSDGDLISPNVVPSDTGVILSTGEADRFTNDSSQSNIRSNTTSASSGPNNDPDFNALAGANTFDASFLEIDFVPDEGIEFLSIDFVFASEEYPEFVGSIYNDIVGVWIDGNPVELSVGTGEASVTNISPLNNVNLYNDNTSDQFNTEMDGFTITMTLTFPVRPEEVNSIKIGIADTADSAFDSNLLIAGGGVQGALVAQDDTTTLFPDGTRTLDLLANDINNTAGTLSITAINGQTVVAGSVVTLPAGQTVTVNGDGTITVVTDSDVEFLGFTYEVSSTTGETDTGFVTLDTIPCFTTGTMIETPTGHVAVETLAPGDLVITRDEGARPVRWVGCRTVSAVAEMAPILIRSGALGDHNDLLVSPLHRILVSDMNALLLFGDEEVLVAAKDLVNDRSITRKQGGEVTYVHLLFDRHQVIYSEGLPTESFLPGPQTTHCFEPHVMDEICTIFPELDPETGEGYSPAARRTLKSYEAQLLKAERIAA